jgi:hypothetical protein
MPKCGEAALLVSLPANGESAERCPLMRRVGLQGVRRGRRLLTTRPDRSGERPPDRVNRDFAAAAPRPAVHGGLRAP